MYCRYCGNELKDDVCPVCGASATRNSAVQDDATTPRPIYKKWWFWVIAVIVALAIIGSAAGGGASDEDVDSAVQTSDIISSQTASVPSQTADNKTDKPS